LGDQVQIGPELVRSNQVVNPHEGVMEKRERDGDEVKSCSIVH